MARWLSFSSSSGSKDVWSLDMGTGEPLNGMRWAIAGSRARTNVSVQGQKNSILGIAYPRGAFLSEMWMLAKAARLRP
jgi:hypothetical protein